MVKYWRRCSAALLPILAFAGASALGIFLLNWIDAAFSALLVAAVLYVAVIDLDRFEIPDMASLAIFLLGLGWTLQDSGYYAAALIAPVERALLCSGFFLAIRAGYRTLRDVEGLGLGDVKLAGAGASWLSWSHAVFALTLAVTAAIALFGVRSLVTQERIHGQTAIPFGAFLAPAIWIAWFVQVLVT